MSRLFYVASILFAATILVLSVMDYAGAQSAYEAEIEAQCAQKGCDAALVIAVMYCESEGNPNAWHANPYGGSDVGLFQINDATWGDIAWAGPWAQIDWATTMIANGGLHHWWPSQWCWGG